MRLNEIENIILYQQYKRLKIRLSSFLFILFIAFFHVQSFGQTEYYLHQYDVNCKHYVDKNLGVFRINIIGDFSAHKKIAVHVYKKKNPFSRKRNSNWYATLYFKENVLYKEEYYNDNGQLNLKIEKMNHDTLYIVSNFNQIGSMIERKEIVVSNKGVFQKKLSTYYRSGSVKMYRNYEENKLDRFVNYRENGFVSAESFLTNGQGWVFYYNENENIRSAIYLEDHKIKTVKSYVSNKQFMSASGVFLGEANQYQTLLNEQIPVLMKGKITYYDLETGDVLSEQLVNFTR